MRRIYAFAIILLAIAALYAQGSGEEDGTLRIGISKLMAHPALDDIERGIIDYLEENGIDAEYDIQNANGDISTAASIANVFSTEGVDIAIGIASPTAQALANAFEDIPVVFATVTDVEAAGLVGLDNVAGTSDEVPIREHFSLIERLTGARSIGMVYTSGEANGISSMEKMKAVCEENGVQYDNAYVYPGLKRPNNIYEAHWGDDPKAWINRINYDPETEEKYNKAELERLGAYKNYQWLRKPMIWQ